MKIGKYEIDNGWFFIVWIIIIFSVFVGIIYFDDPYNLEAQAEDASLGTTNIHDYVVLLDYPVDSTNPVSCWVLDKASIHEIVQRPNKARYWMKNGDNLLITYDEALQVRDTYDNIITNQGLKDVFCKGEQYR